MFKEERDKPLFTWSQIGDITKGRPNLGDTTSVAVYRLFQYTMRDILILRFGTEVAGEIVYDAGRHAGIQFAENILDTDLEMDAFIARAQEQLKELGIGIMRMEKIDPENGEFTLTIDEDLDCSGLPPTEETVCTYDEGFIAGILEAYTGTRYRVREVDCWAMGGRTCRFDAKKAAAS